MKPTTPPCGCHEALTVVISDRTVQVPICDPTFQIGTLSLWKFPCPELSLHLRRGGSACGVLSPRADFALADAALSALCPVIAFFSSPGQLPNYRSQGRKCSCRGVPVYGMAAHPFIKNHCSNVLPSILPVLFLKKGTSCRT